MRHDKKGHAGRPRFVVPRAPGEIAFGIEFDESVLHEVLAAG
jgi:3-dehydroquinate synthetase